MTLDEAKHILSMIRHEQRYRRMVNARLRDLQDIGQEINELSSLHSPLDGSGVRSQNPVGFASRLTQLITDEQDCIKDYNKVKALLDDSVRYLKQVKEQTKNYDDRQFIEEYLSGNKSMLDMQEYGYSNPYERMITIIRKLDIKI